MKKITSRKELIEKIKIKLCGSSEVEMEDLWKILRRMHKNNEFNLKWKIFEQNELYNAEYHAVCGGIALHKMNIKADEFFSDKTSSQTKRAFSGKEFAHLFGPTVEHLIKEAIKIRCKAEWVQKTDPPHFDLVGTPLKLALAKCYKEK